MTAVSDVWIAAGDGGLLDPKGDIISLEDAHLLAAGNAQMFCFSRKRAEVLHLQKESWLPAAPGLEAMCPCESGRYLYELSGEADALICVDVKSARPVFSIKCGCYPQDLCLHPSHSMLAAALGATGEISVYQAPNLVLQKNYRVPGIATRVAFIKQGIVFLSAVEKGEVHTMLGLIRHGAKAFEEVALFKGLPGALCALPDGSIALSVWGQIIRLWIRPFKVLFSYPLDGLVTHIEQAQGQLLLTDTASGAVSLIGIYPPHQRRQLFRGEWVHGIFG